MKKPAHSIRDAARLSGVEESRIRFIERMFPENFPDTARGYAPRDLDRLREIDALIRQHGNNLSAVRADLRGRHPAAGRAPRVITVTSGKGGVGKTTVALNLSLAFARRGVRTLLFDADLGLANVHVLAGLSPRQTIVELLQGQATMDELIHEAPGGLKVICGGSGIGGLADLKMEFVRYLGREIRRMAETADLVVIDTAAGLTASVLHFISLADDVVVVATPNLASTLDAYSLIKVAQQERVPGRIRLLVNHAADEAQAAHVRDKILACARKFLAFEPEPLGFITRDPLIELSTQRREPYLLAHPDTDNADRFLLAADLLRAATPDPAAAAPALAAP